MTVRGVTVLGTLFFLSLVAHAQIVFNEVCTSNSTIVADLQGEYGDWFELYNTSDDEVNLNGYSVSDDSNDLSKWQFGDVTMPAKSHLLVFASGKDLNTVAEPDTISVLSKYYWTWADIDNDPPGKSTIKPLDFTGILQITNGKPEYSARMFTGNNYASGDLGWHATVLTINVGSTYGDYSRLTKLNVTATITDGRDVKVRLVQQDVADWLGYAYTITGNGIKDFTYEIPLHDATAATNLKRLKGIKYEGQLPEGNTDIHITDQQLIIEKSHLHTNFKLSSKGETLYLSNASDKIIDEVSVPQMLEDFSLGRVTDGSSEFGVFRTASPGASNDGIEAYSGFCTKPIEFSAESGFYAGSKTISLSGASKIRYTLDGSTVTALSPLFQNPLKLDSTTVVNVACFDGNSFPIKQYTNTYFIDDQSKLPVLSISTDPANFFDYNTGIYVDGPNWTEKDPHDGANYWQDWKRPIYIEYFDKSGKPQLEQGAIANIMGGWSRMNPQKSLKIEANDKAIGNVFNYKFFEHKTNTQFKDLMLRNSGNDCNYLHFHDAISQECARKHTDIDLQAYQPVAVFINGRYWGIQNIREKINAQYIEDNHGVSTDTLELFETWGSHINSGNTDFMPLYDQIMSADMTNESTYASLIANFDLQNFIDFFAVNIIISNWDWPQNNLKFWYSPYTKKYRYIMYDTDISLGKFGIQPYDFNQLQRILTSADCGYHAQIFSKFMKNKGFRNAFINRSADLMNTDFSKKSLNATIDSIHSLLADEMPKHKKRWGGSVSDWQWNIDLVKKWVDNRMPVAYNQISAQYSLPKQVSITLDAMPQGAGVVKINSVIPETMPWTGLYFDGVPVTVTAVPNPGYTFSHWSAPGLTDIPSMPSFTQNIPSSQSLTAYFVGEKATPSIVVSELNYNPSLTQDVGDWFELYNSGTSAIDLTGWKIKDENDYTYYTFPNNFGLNAGDYYVFASDTAKFDSEFSFIPVQPVPFNLSSGGDKIRIFDRNGALVYQLQYNDKSPWPTNSDGQGYTLELQSPAADPNDPASWFSGCLLGSPDRAYDPSCPEITSTQQIASELSVYPNPAHTYVTVGGNSGFIQSLSITDISGNVLLSRHNLGSSAQISVKDLHPGLYFVTIRAAAGTSVAKLQIR